MNELSFSLLLSEEMEIKGKTAPGITAQIKQTA
jgi:hypothetical protein